MSLARAEKADLMDGTVLGKPGSSPAPSGGAPSGAAPMPPGGVFFATAARQAEASRELTARRYLLVEAPPEAAAPGQLLQAIDLAVEGALALRGALPPGAPVDAGAEATVRDQVMRARALGAAGVALTLPPLSGREESRLLSFEDGALLSAWIAAAQRGSVVVLLDERDRDVRVLAPRRLAELTSSGRRAPLWSPRPPESEPPSAPAAKDAIPPSGEVEKPAADPSPATFKEGALERAALAGARTSLPSPDEEDPPTQRYRAGREPPPPPVMAMPRRGVMKKRPRAEALAAARSPEPEAAANMPVETPAHAPVEAPAHAPVEAPAHAPVEAPAHAPVKAPVVKAAEPAPAQIIAPPEPPPLERSVREPEEPRLDIEAAPEPGPSARRVMHAAEWRAHAVELDKARGPKPVSVIDRLFTTRYMPLLGAIARSEVDGAVKSVVDAWRMNFEHSYREAFSALRVTGKRPPMVFDAPDLASRLGRLNGARAVKLLLVDAMRFDIGERVAARLGERLTGRAVCVERTLLWSAIPTSTPTQMALLARGAEGLREAEPPADPEGEIIRGRAVGTVRRERVGAREVMKLDLVESRLRMAGAGYEDRIDSLAEEVSQITTRYVETLPPRTLLFMFGDHGFRMAAGADGRSTAAADAGRSFTGRGPGARVCVVDRRGSLITLPLPKTPPSDHDAAL